MIDGGGYSGTGRIFVSTQDAPENWVQGLDLNEYETSEIDGGTLYINSQGIIDALKLAIANGSTYYSLNDFGQVTILEDMLIPEGVYVDFWGTRLVVPAGVTLTVEGSMDGDSKAIEGTVYINGGHLHQNDIEITDNGILRLRNGGADIPLDAWTDSMRQHVIFEEDCYLNMNAVAETLEQLVGEITPKIGAPEDHVTYWITVLFPYVAESDEPVELGVLENVALEFYKGTHGENGSMTIGEGVTYVVDGRLKFNGSTLTVRGSLINNCQIELEGNTDRGWGNIEFADGAVYDGSGVIWVVAQENPEVRLGGLTQKYRFAQSEGFNNGTFYHKEASVEFTVSYDANGGSGASAPQIKQEG